MSLVGDAALRLNKSKSCVIDEARSRRNIPETARLPWLAAGAAKGTLDTDSGPGSDVLLQAGAIITPRLPSGSLAPHLG